MSEGWLLFFGVLAFLFVLALEHIADGLSAIAKALEKPKDFNLKIPPIQMNHRTVEESEVRNHER